MSSARTSPADAPGAALSVTAAALACAGTYLAARLLLRGGHGFPLDDSYIHLQFARNLAAGHGLAYNAGELVTGSTAPLWTALVTLLGAAGGAVAAVKLAGVLLHCASVHATLVLGREMGLSRGGARLAAAFTLGTGWLVWGALSGLEVPLFTLLSLWGVILHLRERGGSEPGRSLAVLALAALARPEGLLLILLALADRLLLWRREEAGLALAWPPLAPVAHGLAAAALLLVPMALFSTAVGGSPLPTTFFAKGAGSSIGLPQTSYLFHVLGILFREQPAPVLFAGAGVVFLVRRLGGRDDRGLLPALWLFALPLAFAVLSPRGGSPLVGNFGRYFFPLFPFLALVGAAGLEAAGTALGPRLSAGSLRLPLRPALAVLVLLPSVFSLVRGAGRYTQAVGNVRDGDVAVTSWLAPRLPPGATLAVNDVGVLKYRLPENRVLDLAGILDPEVVRYRAEALAAGRPAVEGDLRFLAETRPDYLVIFPDWFPGLMALDDAGFRPLHQVTVPGNIALGDDRIVVLSTPWTRAPLRQPPAGASGSPG